MLIWVCVIHIIVRQLSLIHSIDSISQRNISPSFHGSYTIIIFLHPDASFITNYKFEIEIYITMLHIYGGA